MRCFAAFVTQLALSTILWACDAPVWTLWAAVPLVAFIFSRK